MIGTPSAFSSITVSPGSGCSSCCPGSSSCGSSAAGTLRLQSRGSLVPVTRRLLRFPEVGLRVIIRADVVHVPNALRLERSLVCIQVYRIGLRIDYLDDDHRSPPVLCGLGYLAIALLGLHRDAHILALGVQGLELTAVLVIEPEIERGIAGTHPARDSGSFGSRDTHHRILRAEVLSDDRCALGPQELLERVTRFGSVHHVSGTWMHKGRRRSTCRLRQCTCGLSELAPALMVSGYTRVLLRIPRQGQDPFP